LAVAPGAVYRLPTMRIDEIFCSIQGEGSRRGRPCTFVRLTGCPLRCRWCDTAYAFHGGEEMSVAQVLERVAAYRPRLVCVTGGEPLAQPAVHELLAALLESGYEVVLETSGALDARAVDGRVVRILDLKAPGSGESSRNHWPTFEELRPTDEIKVVVADREDFEWAIGTIRERGLVDRVACVLLSPVHGELDGAQLAEWMLEEDLPLVLQLQEHKILWPGVERGV
jgi:7-carboxy-7-deazaguanine synthase